MRKLLAILCALVICLSACQTERGHSIYNGQKLRAGDIVLRCGTGIASRAVLMADEGGHYSHVGIVVDSSGVMMIVHAVPDEPEWETDVDRIKMDAVDVFYSSIRASSGMVLRCEDSIWAQRAASVAYALYKARILFDHEYDACDTTMMYCSEMVEHAYRKAGGQSITGCARHDIDLPAFHYNGVILPSDFMRSDHLKTITVF